jgi:acyl-homoserine-lactone acylase
MLQLKFSVLFACLFCIGADAAQAAALPDRSQPDEARWHAHVQAVSITRDDWGIAHIHGHSDADAVFGFMYAQAEDDFNRIETNYLNSLGWLAQAEGAGALFTDLRMRLFVDQDDLKRRYAGSPAWLQTLMVAWADGLNWFLATHPQVVPRVIHRFEPWMALSFSEGSIGGDVERISSTALEALYGKPDRPPPLTAMAQPVQFEEPGGSNGIAIAPANTRTHHALLLINPHTSFFFRSEAKVESDEGLNVYGAATWGQFFIYQGFNERCGWMHTSTGADAVDEYRETIIKHDGHFFYRYGAQQLPLIVSDVVVPYRQSNGKLAERHFRVYRTRHGPIVREADGHWISVQLMYRPVEALSQSYLRTKAHDFASFLKIADFKANSSNNTIYADADGNIAYLHPSFLPRRDDRFDFTRPVDGSDPATDWHGLHELDETPHLLNPSNGWIANTNNWPYSAAGDQSPKWQDYPHYMDSAGENARGIHARLLLSDQTGFTLESLMGAAYDSYLPAFARLLPVLIDAWHRLPDDDQRKAQMRDQIALLQSWNDRWALDSTATSLAVFWADELQRTTATLAQEAGVKVQDYIAERASGDMLLAALDSASQRLVDDFGSWRTPWGEINRFQRLDDAIQTSFDDSKPSTAVPFTSGEFGSLASFGAHRRDGTRRYYGTSGNSFVAVVEFADTVRARAVTAGGESGDVASAHFNDEAGRYAGGELREVYFYASQLQGHTERVYHPGD